MSDTANNTGNDQKKKEDDLDETNRTSESENEKDDKSSVTKPTKKEKEKPSKPVKKGQKKEKRSEDDTNESEDEEEEEGDEEEDDDDEEEEEEEKKLGLLDLPLVVSGSRERKKVERLEIGYPVATKEKKPDISEGSGEKLGDCPQIEIQIQKFKSDDLKPLHRLLFNRPGAVAEIKKNIRKFNGFPFDKDSPDFEKKKSVLDKMTTVGLKQICEILGLERKGTKDEVVKRVMSFLLCPKSSGKGVAKGRKKSTSKTDKRKSKAEKPKSRSNSTKKTKSKATNEKDSESENEVQSEQESEKDEEDSSEEEKPKKKKVSRKDTKKPVKQKNNKQETKLSKSNKQQMSDDEEDNDSSDDEPLMKKAKQPPTDEELKTLIKSILDGANLEEITMKTVCKQVYESYPDFDLSDRKYFIKITVRSIIS